MEHGDSGIIGSISQRETVTIATTLSFRGDSLRYFCKRAKMWACALKNVPLRKILAKSFRQMARLVIRMLRESHDCERRKRPLEMHFFNLCIEIDRRYLVGKILPRHRVRGFT